MTNQRTPASYFNTIMLLAMSLGLFGCSPGPLFSPAATPDPNLPPLNARLGDTWVSPDWLRLAPLGSRPPNQRMEPSLTTALRAFARAAHPPPR
jgi:hypothetical protein